MTRQATTVNHRRDGCATFTAEGGCATGAPGRERELAAILSAYNEATEQLKSAHERLNEEVARLREELRRKNAELRRRERLAALGEMAAGLAHEIRNPLGGIALYASMLEKELADRPRAQTAAAKISQAVRALERLVSEILEFAQEHRLERQVCELGGILTAVEDGARPWAEECGATMTFETAAFDLKVYCDPTRLRQVLLNLVMNAVQAAGKGGNVRVTAKRRNVETSKRRNAETPLPASHATPLNTSAVAPIEIAVCDDGPGIPAENLERIFNPFFTTRASGTGLGLAIVHRIIEAHGGTVRAGNRREGGARFVVRLPGKRSGRPPCRPRGGNVETSSRWHKCGTAALGCDVEKSKSQNVKMQRGAEWGMRNVE